MLLYIYIYIYISIRAGFSFTETDNLQDSRGREGTILFHSTTSTRSRTFRHLFATLYVRWLSHIFNRNACIYHTATRWDLPPYRITIWLIDDVMCLHVELSLGFCYSYMTWETGGLELASTIILVLQVNRLTKSASHPKYC